MTCSRNKSILELTNLHKFLFWNFHSRRSWGSWLGLMLGSPVLHHRCLRLELGVAVTAAHGVHGNLVLG